MTGTAKQIAWANDIIDSYKLAIECMRRNIIRDTEVLHQAYSTDSMGMKFEMADIDACAEAADKFFSQATAAQIIERRSVFSQQQLSAMCSANYRQRNK